MLCVWVSALAVAFSRRAVIGIGASLATLCDPQTASSTVCAKHDLEQLYFYDRVTTESSLALQTALLRGASSSIQSASVYNAKPYPLHLHINSLGGELTTGLFISDLLANLTVPVHTHVEGVCASAATLLSVVGAHRTITKHSVMLLHQPRIVLSDSYKFTEVRDHSANLQLLTDSISDIYRSYTRLDDDSIKLLLGRDVYLDAATCMEYGIVDEIV